MKQLLLFPLLILACASLWAQENCPNLYPAPRLFYIQRTGSADTIVYDANTAPDGRFVADNPVYVYWRRAPQGRVENLNYLQRTKGYGVKTVSATKSGEYYFHLVSYAQRNFLLKKDDCGQPVAMLAIAGKEAYLQRMFIEMEPGLKPTVHYIELFGIEVQTGYAIYEKVIP